MNLQDVAHELGIRQGKGTNQFYCPRHDEDAQDPDADMYIETDKFVCFDNNQEGGRSPVTLVMHTENCNIETALEILKEKFPEEFQDTNKENIERRKQVKKILNKATDIAHDTLVKKEEALMHNIKENRGFDQEDIEDSKIGFLSEDDCQILLDRFNKQLLSDAGLYNEEYDYIHLKNRVIFPYREHGQTYFMIGRKTREQQEHKYKKLSNTKYNKHILYNFTDKNNNKLVITEGVTDAISAHKAGYNVISPVTTTFRNSDIKKIVRKAKNFEEIYLVNDGDESGRKGQEKTAQELLKENIHPVIVELETGKDLDDYTCEHGYDIDSLLESGEDYLKTKIDQIKRFESEDNVNKQNKKTKELLKTIKDWEDMDLDPVLKKLPGSKRKLEKHLKKIKREYNIREKPEDGSFDIYPEAGIPTDTSPTQKQISYHFAQWLCKNRDITAVMLDYEKDIYHIRTYNPETKIWENNGQQRIAEFGHKELGEEYTKNVKNEIIEKLRAIRKIDFDHLDPETGKIAVENGLLDLETENLREIKKEDYLKTRLPVKYNPDADCQKFLEYLEEVVESQADRKKLQEYIGYTLLVGSAKYQKMLMLLGPTDSGKSVFLKTIRTLLGHENCAEESLKQLADTRWSVSKINDKIANIDHDLNAEEIDNIGRIKKLASGDRITAEIKGEPKFTIKPACKHMFAANKAPNRSEDDTAFYNRWITVQFNHTIPDEDQDKHLVEKLTSESELQGILNWAISGLKRLEDNGQFTEARMPVEIKEMWKQYGGSVEQFVSDCLTKKKDVLQAMKQDPEKGEEDVKELRDTKWKLHTSTLYELYQTYVNKKHMEQVSKNKFSSILKDQAGVRKGKPTIDGSTNRGYFGLRIVEGAHQKIESGEI